MFSTPTHLKSLAVFATLAAGLTGCTEEAEPPAEVIKPIAWTRAVSADLETVRRISGVLKAAERADLSFLVGGRVEGVNVNLGDEVTAGQVLATLDEASFELSARATEGEVHEAKARLVEAEAEFERQKDLNDKGWASVSALDNARRLLNTAQSAVEIAEARLELSKKDLRDTALRAPYDGTIVARRIEPSQQVTAGQVVIEIEGQEGLEVSVMAPENIVGALSNGGVFPARFPAQPTLSLDAQITEIGSQAESANAFPVTLLLQFQSELERSRLRAGMTAEVDFRFASSGRTGYDGKAVKVPPTALMSSEGQGAFVYVFDEGEGVVRRRDVQTEDVSDNDVLLSRGLEPGEIIAVAGVAFLHDGQKVRLLDVGVKTFN